MRKSYYLEDGVVREGESAALQILHFVNPTDSEKEWLVQTCGISTHTISSALDPDELGRMELEDGVLTLIMNTPKNYHAEDDFLFKVLTKGIILLPDRLVILTQHEEITMPQMPGMPKMADLTDVLLVMLAGTISHFLAHLKVINMLSDSLEKKINTSMANQHLLSMFTIGKSLVYYLSGISSNHSVMEKLRNNAKRLGFKERHFDYLDDIIIDNGQCTKQAQIYSDILTGLMDARGSIVNNNLNLLIKRLTIINIVFMPLNIIASVGGMSEFSVWTAGIPHWISYSVFTVGMGLVAWLTYLIVRKYSGDAATRVDSGRRRPGVWIRSK